MNCFTDKPLISYTRSKLIIPIKRILYNNRERKLLVVLYRLHGNKINLHPCPFRVSFISSRAENYDSLLFNIPYKYFSI